MQAKDKAEHSVYSSESNSEEYASERIADGVSTVAREAIHQVDVQGHRIIQGAQKQIAKRQEMRQFQQAAPENPQPPPNAPRTEQTTPNTQQPHRVSPDGTVTPVNGVNSKTGSGTPILKQEAVRNRQIASAKSKLRAKRASRQTVTHPQHHIKGVGDGGINYIGTNKSPEKVT